MIRRAHGRARELGRVAVVEVPPPDELSSGVQAPPHVERTGERDELGRWQPGARTTQSKGGRARREETRLARRLGLTDLPEDAAFRPYKAAAASFRRFHVASLARSVGGGHCGPGPSSIVATAAWQLAVSRYLFDKAASSGKAADFALASRLANDSRQNLLAAHELCAREAHARPHDEADLAQTMLDASKPRNRPRSSNG